MSKFNTTKNVATVDNKNLKVPQPEPSSIISPLIQLLREKDKEKEERRKEQEQLISFQVVKIPHKEEEVQKSKSNDIHFSKPTMASKEKRIKNSSKINQDLEKPLFTKSR